MKDQEFLPLDDYEKELIQAIENEDFAPLERSEFIKQKAMLQEAAKNTISNRTTRKAITFKPDPKVLELFKLKANNEYVKSR